MNPLWRRIFFRTNPVDAMINDTALNWISRREAGVTPATEAEFQSWLAADAQHRAAIAALQPTWTTINRPRHMGHGSELRRQVQARVSRRRRRRLKAGLASAVAATVVLFAIVQFRPGAGSPGQLTATVAMRPDCQMLADGSRVHLNANASVVVDYTATERRVRLVNGEALFEVAKDSARPFIVSAGHVEVRAVGTAFAVRLDSTEIDVLVTHGEVAVEPSVEADRASPKRHKSADTTDAPVEPRIASAPMFVSAGRRVVVPLATAALEGLEPRTVSSQEVATALAWQNRRVEFNGTSLADAIELFNRDNPVQLAVDSPGTGAIRITGVFWTNNPEAFSRAVELSLGLTATRVTDKRIELRK